MGNRKPPLFRPHERTWSIRAKTVSLLLVPLLALVVMWLLATAVTLRPGLILLETQTTVDAIGRPAQALLVELQQERKLTAAYLAGQRRDGAAALAAQRSRTDAAVANFRRLSQEQDALRAATPITTARLTEHLQQLDSLLELRESIDRGELDRSGAMRRYTAMTEASLALFGSLIRATDEDLTRQANALLLVSRATEVLAQEDAMITGASAAGRFSAAELSQTVQLIGAQRYMFNTALTDLHPDDQADYVNLARSGPFTRLAELENEILTEARAGADVPVTANAWSTTYDEVATRLHEFELRAADRLAERSRPAALTIIGRIVVTGVFGLIVVVVTVIASIRLGRNVIRRLAGLRQAALELAVDRLPRVVARLRRGEEVDVALEAPPLPYGNDEIGQVGHAFNELQRTAVNSAVEEARVRQGLNEVFLNIARRSQALLHRQLAILDRMERRAEDPTELEDLFRIDHLATRMRRHAEDLVILAGATPARGWRHPVRMIDVVRGAVSEVEDYARVTIRPMAEIGLVGPAVADVIHLLAELIENATSFSPPHTRVTVGGEAVVHGFAIEVDDRGLGMPPEALEEANRRLANPPDFDPAHSAQLGLFVVARLAARHGIKVQLRASAYGGITAVVLLPETLIITDPKELPPRRGAVAALPSGAHPVVSVREDSAAPEDPGEKTASTPRRRTRRSAVAEAVEAEVVGPEPVVAAETVPPERMPAHAARAEAKPIRRQGRHARPEVIEPSPADGPDALPRRIRQRNLAPGLRDMDPAAARTPTQGAPTRSPEELRAMMSSFQAGLARGRRDAQDADASASERDTRR